MDRHDGVVFGQVRLWTRRASIAVRTIGIAEKLAPVTLDECAAERTKRHNQIGRAMVKERVEIPDELGFGLLLIGPRGDNRNFLDDNGPG